MLINPSPTEEPFAGLEVKTQHYFAADVKLKGSEVYKQGHEEPFAGNKPTDSFPNYSGSDTAVLCLHCRCTSIGPISLCGLPHHLLGALVSGRWF